MIDRIEYDKNYQFFDIIVKAIEPDRLDSLKCIVEFQGERYQIAKEHFCNNATLKED